jgi:hypothetical protein
MELRILPAQNSMVRRIVKSRLFVTLLWGFESMKVLIADNGHYCRDFLQDLEQSVEKLKQKWTAFTRGIIDVIAEEEMRISRQEFDKQIEANFKHSQWERRTAHPPDTKRITRLVSDATDQPQDLRSHGSNSHGRGRDEHR